MPSAEELGISSVEEVVAEQLGIEGRKAGREYVIHCPNPRHLDRKPSCNINLETGYWHCLACGVGGDLIKLGMQVLKWEASAVEEFLRPGTVESLQATVAARLRRAYARNHQEPPPTLPLHAPGPLGDLRKRGFSQETLERWSVRWVSEAKFTKNSRIKHSLALPIMDEKQKLMGWVYRRTETSYDWQPKYLNSPSLEINKIWYGLQHHARTKHIVIVEGALDALWCDQAGIPALALLGSQPSWSKIKLLQRYQSVTLLPDLDKAGAQWVKTVLNELSGRVHLRIARYPKWAAEAARQGKKIDPLELHPIDLEIALYRSITDVQWRRRYAAQARPDTPNWRRTRRPRWT